jgi:DNA-binding IclR family transcriptional regulator
MTMRAPDVKQVVGSTPRGTVDSPAAPALLERQIAVVERVAESPGGLSFTGIQQKLGLSKATAHRLVQSLCAAGLLEASQDAARLYRLGGRLTRLLGLAVSPDQLVPLARPLLREIVDEYGETAFLAMLERGQVTTITMVTPVKDWQGHVHPGRIMPPHAAASAKAIFAFQDEAMWDATLRPPLQAFTAKTLTDPAAVRREYRRVKKSGIATCVEEIDPGQLAVAAPIPLGTVGTRFSVCLVGPTNRMREHSIERVTASLRSLASRLSEVFVGRIESA